MAGIHNTAAPPPLSGLEEAEAEAFWDTWAAHKSQLRAVCTARLGPNHHDAEDALNDLMLETYLTLPRKRRRIKNPGAWLRRLAHNLSIDAFRKRQRCDRDLQPLHEVFADDGSIELSISSRQAPDQQLLLAELALFIGKAFEALPGRLREIATGYFLDNLSLARLSQLLGISAANARQRLRRSRELLRDRLKPYVAGSEERCSRPWLRGNQTLRLPSAGPPAGPPVGPRKRFLKIFCHTRAP